MKILLFILGLVLSIIGIASIIFVAIYQLVLCYRTFGVIFNEVFIPHWSAWFLFGFVPMFLGWLIIAYSEGLKK